MNNSEKTTSDELRDMVTGNVKLFLKWIKPNQGENILLQIFKLIIKVPVILLMVAASPILLLVLIIVFLIAL